MLSGKKVYAVVPARAGSKGIPKKNLYRLRGRTLLERAIRLGQSSKRVDRVLVSTDDADMQSIAERHGAAMPGLRPPELSTDGARTVDVLAHVIREVGIEDALILLLQTTSPLRTRSDLEALLDTFEARAGEADAIVSLARHAEPHPDKMQQIRGGYIRSYLGRDGGAPRQTLPELYRFNGAFYLVRSPIIVEQRTLLPERTLPFVMPAERSINLDGFLDLVLLEALVERGIVTVEDC
jgi:CMP-N,N'-diacetyllegionaminic acid synthase